MIPYGRHLLDDDDIRAVVETLRSDWLTTGPAVKRFEDVVARRVGAEHGVAVSSGTAALHLVLAACGVGPGDEVVVPAMTFAATANAALYCGATPVFADVASDSLLLTPETLAPKLGPKTAVVIAVDYAGHPCDYPALEALCREGDVPLFADACHALGGADESGRAVGSLAGASCFSFHPVKHVAVGEGGMVVTSDADLAHKVRQLRSHGVNLDHAARSAQGTWRYDVADLGWNYRLSDISCALGVSQMNKLDASIHRRREIAATYDAALADMTGVRSLATRDGVGHARHLYVVRIGEGKRDAVFTRLRGAGIGVNVHYWPVHLHSLYRERLGTGEGDCPVAEAAVQEILSLPMHAGLTDQEVRTVLRELEQAL